MKVVRTKIYTRKISKLLTERELLSVEKEIISFPEKWPIIVGTGGIRKARAARGNSGKSGGLRIMYYFWQHKENIFFLDVFAKNEKENLDAQDKEQLRQITDILKKMDV